jgi:transposase-like protein
MRTKRRYSDSDKSTALALLAANGGNISATARETQLPATTIRQWRDGVGISENVLSDSEVKKDELHSLFERVARLYLNQAMQVGTVRKTSGKDSVIAAATATDKMRLLTEQATSISKDVSEHSHEERANRILELVKPARTG